MSRPENPPQMKIIEGPTVLAVEQTGIVLGQGGNMILFSSVDDFQEFLNRVSILAVRLDQAMHPEPGDENPPAGDAGTEP